MQDAAQRAHQEVVRWRSMPTAAWKEIVELPPQIVGQVHGGARRRPPHPKPPFVQQVSGQGRVWSAQHRGLLLQLLLRSSLWRMLSAVVQTLGFHTMTAMSAAVLLKTLLLGGAASRGFKTSRVDRTHATLLSPGGQTRTANPDTPGL